MIRMLRILLLAIAGFLIFRYVAKLFATPPSTPKGPANVGGEKRHRNKLRDEEIQEANFKEIPKP